MFLSCICPILDAAYDLFQSRHRRKLYQITQNQIFFSCFWPKNARLLPSFARFKPAIHVPREILSYRKKNHVNRNNITVVTTASIWQLFEVQIGGSNSLIIHQSQSPCIRSDALFVTIQ